MRPLKKRRSAFLSRIFFFNVPFFPSAPVFSVDFFCGFDGCYRISAVFDN